MIAGPQAPIARVTVREGLAVRTGLYAPGLPDGDHDLYCVPEAVSPMMRDTTENSGERFNYSDGPVWHYFGLTYSSYLVLPRRGLCSMPVEWQRRFVALMEEAERLLPEEAQGGDYMVRRREGGRFV